MSNKKNNLRLVDAPIYRYWQALYLSFFSRRLYVDVAKRWRGYGVLYLLLVIAIAAIPLSARIVYYFNQYFNERMITPVQSIPPLYIQDGKVTFDKPMPYLIKNKSNDVVAIIDTTGAVTGISNAYPELTVLITQTKIYFRPPKFPLSLSDTEKPTGEKVYVQPLNKGINEIFVGKDWIVSSGILKMKLVAEWLVYPLLIGFIFGLYVGTLLFLSFIAQLVSIIIFKMRFTFKESCRLFLVASTPQVAIFFALHTANISPPGEHYFYIIISSIYFSYAALSVKRESRSLVRG